MEDKRTYPCLHLLTDQELNDLLQLIIDERINRMENDHINFIIEQRLLAMDPTT